MGRPKIEFDEALWNRMQKHAGEAGYSSTEEFVVHAIEKALSGKDAEPADPKKIKGIGYLDAGLDI
ncbi:MAG TPA: hypothetical protein VMS37_22555 [Verrucomicrobiae bacterium]|nr:hypothetical protein [Verrucomicrobiae bacterium]